MTVTTSLPRWDVSGVYPGLESAEFQRDMRDIADRVQKLGALLDQYGIDQGEPAPLDDHTARVFEELTAAFSDVLERIATLSAYITAFVSTDSRDAVAAARESELQQPEVRLSQLWTRFIGWLGSLDVPALIAQSSAAQQHAFLLERASEQARHLMSPGEEALAAEMNVTGGSSWSRLYDKITSQLMVPLELDGTRQELPMSVVRNLALEPDRQVRHAAYDAELAAWKRAAVPLAASLNSIKGESNTLAERRHWGEVLDEALFNNNIDRQTLDAMFEAAWASFPDFRRYLHAKARLLGIPALAWYDLFAPVGESERAWDFEPAREFLLDQFGSYSPRLRGFAERAFRERWVDAEPREGKQGGAFCMSLRADESRILANYQPSYTGMSTLAHELGHGYHNLNLSIHPILLRDTPMTLAETASTFCETIVREAALQDADEAEQLAILESSLQDSCQIVVDISSRFLFERAVFEARQKRELSVVELNELMLDAQRQTYGNGLDENLLHPYMWAAKGHYYSVSQPYYNFPYMFGLLFGLGLYAQYQQDPETFRAKYDALLSSTGRGNAAALAGRFGIDVRTPDFWTQSLDVIRNDIVRFEALIAREQQNRITLP